MQKNAKIEPLDIRTIEIATNYKEVLIRMGGNIRRVIKKRAILKNIGRWTINAGNQKMIETRKN